MIFATFVGRGCPRSARSPGPARAAGEFSTSPAWEPTLPLDRAGGARSAAGYSVKKTRALWLPRPGRLPRNRSADAPLHRQPRRRETQTGMVKPCRVRSGQLRPAQGGAKLVPSLMPKKDNTRPGNASWEPQASATGGPSVPPVDAWEPSGTATSPPEARPGRSVRLDGIANGTIFYMWSRTRGDRHGDSPPRRGNRPPRG